MDSGEAEIRTQGGGRNIAFGRDLNGPVIELPLTADVVAGDREVTLLADLGALLAVGDTVMWLLGLRHSAGVQLR